MSSALLILSSVQNLLAFSATNNSFVASTALELYDSKIMVV